MEYKAIAGYEGAYEVSDTGVVRSLDRVDPRGNHVAGRVLKPSLDWKRYLKVRLFKNGIGRTCKIHTLVAQAFIGPRPQGLTINHIDGVKKNNHASNLEYVTNAANVQHAVDNGFGRPQAKLTEADAMAIYAIGNGQLQDITAQQYGISQAQVSNIVNGKRWKSLTA